MPVQLRTLQTSSGENDSLLKSTGKDRKLASQEKQKMGMKIIMYEMAALRTFMRMYVMASMGVHVL